MPWQTVPVEYSRASVSCDWPACTNRIDLNAIPSNFDAELHELNNVMRLALRHGWTVESASYSVTCPDHKPPENKENP